MSGQEPKMIDFKPIGEWEQLLCKGHIDPYIAIEAAIDFIRHEQGNHFEDCIEALTPNSVKHTIARCIPVSPHDENFGDFDWYLQINQKPGRGAFKATIIDL